MNPPPTPDPYERPRLLRTREITGAAKSIVARRLTTIRPARRLVETLETTRIPRIAGRTGKCTAWV